MKLVKMVTFDWLVTLMISQAGEHERCVLRSSSCTAFQL